MGLATGVVVAGAVVVGFGEAVVVVGAVVVVVGAAVVVVGFAVVVVGAVVVVVGCVVAGVVVEAGLEQAIMSDDIIITTSINKLTASRDNLRFFNLKTSFVLSVLHLVRR